MHARRCLRSIPTGLRRTLDSGSPLRRPWGVAASATPSSGCWTTPTRALASSAPSTAAASASAPGGKAVAPSPKKPHVDFTSVAHWDDVATAGYDESIFGYFNEDFAKQVGVFVGAPTVLALYAPPPASVPLHLVYVLEFNSGLGRGRVAVGGRACAWCGHRLLSSAPLSTSHDLPAWITRGGLQVVRRHSGPSSSFLDIGTGTGQVALALAAKYPEAKVRAWVGECVTDAPSSS
jgi:hypothetical protein